MELRNFWWFGWISHERKIVFFLEWTIFIFPLLLRFNRLDFLKWSPIKTLSSYVILLFERVLQCKRLLFGFFLGDLLKRRLGIIIKLSEAITLCRRNWILHLIEFHWRIHAMMGVHLIIGNTIIWTNWTLRERFRFATILGIQCH